MQTVPKTRTRDEKGVFKKKVLGNQYNENLQRRKY